MNFTISDIKYLVHQEHVLEFSVRYIGADNTLSEYHCTNFNNDDLKSLLPQCGDHEFYNLQFSFSTEGTHSKKVKS